LGDTENKIQCGLENMGILGGWIRTLGNGKYARITMKLI
jgi:hypothetical protein